MTSNGVLYFFTFFSALILSLIFTPAARAAAVVLDIMDHPSTEVKTHKKATPYLGGAAIFLAFGLSLLWIRVLTSFPTGTLRSLRGVLIGGLFIFTLGLLDDINKKGIHYSTKFFFQITATGMIMLFGIHIKFIQPQWFALFLTLAWVVFITNSINLVDIMDGLAGSIVTIAGLAFLFIALPTEDIYVNFTAAALSGAALGFLPYNMSKKMKIFMGDSGSLFCGFVIATLSMGTSYSSENHMGIFVPILILCVPIFDTILVFVLRVRRGESPFLGSHDHFPLRLEKMGWSRTKILKFVISIGILFSIGAYMITHSSTSTSIIIYTIAAVLILLFSRIILQVKI